MTKRKDKVLDVIDAHVDAIIKRNPQAMAELEELVRRYQDGEISNEDRLKEKKRAIRRMQRERMKGRATKVLKRFGFDVHPGYWADNLAKCSCHMCRNARRDGELTKQEMIFYDTDLTI